MADENRDAPEDVVTASTGGGWSDLLRTEDYWAIWLGLFFLAVGLLLYLSNPPAGMREKIAEANAIIESEAARAPFRTVARHEAILAKEGLRSTGGDLGKEIRKLVATPLKWKFPHVSDAFVVGEGRAEERNATARPKALAAVAKALEARRVALASEAVAAAAEFQDLDLNQVACDDMCAWVVADEAARAAGKKAAVKPDNRIPWLIGLAAVLAVLFGLGMRAMGHSFGKFVVGFGFVFGLAILAYFVAGESVPKKYGIGYAAWAILFGLLISNTVGTPKWVKPAVQTEFFIKTGLVLLGAEILFGKILAIGAPGIFVAWIVTPIVLTVTYFFGQRVLKIPSKTLNITISADMSVCGVSAAIATAAACRAKKEELTLAVGMSLVFTSIMMIVMPAFIKAVGIPEVLGGAWMGGTIDATGAVAAAGAFLGQKALYVAATVKMIQNILIGLVAFVVAFIWVTRVERKAGHRVGPMEIWHRFPKFVLGFIGASLLFSAIYSSLGNDAGSTLIDQGVIRGLTKHLRGWCFCLAFASIGLATNFRELAHYFKGGKPLILYVCGQSFNLALTLLMAWIMFYLVFPNVTACL
jgi:uncharacterized membrane protein YadS